MAELADAHGSGPCESNFMEVQVLLSASKAPHTLCMRAFCYRRCSLMVKHQLPKLRSGVRFPSPAYMYQSRIYVFFTYVRDFSFVNFREKFSFSVLISHI